MSLHMLFCEEEYLSLESVSDNDINTIFQELREYHTGWYVKEHIFKRKKLFKRIRHVSYSVYFRSKIDCQAINFYDPEGKINIRVSKDIIITYLMGLLNGYQLKSFF